MTDVTVPVGAVPENEPDRKPEPGGRSSSPSGTSTRSTNPGGIRRYVVTGAFLPLARSSVAIARAEAVTEIPVIGPLLKAHEPAHSGDQS